MADVALPPYWNCHSCNLPAVAGCAVNQPQPCPPALPPCHSYNVLHLRAEKDWLALCEWWQKPEEG